MGSYGYQFSSLSTGVPTQGKLKILQYYSGEISLIVRSLHSTRPMEDGNHERERWNRTFPEERVEGLVKNRQKVPD